MKNEQDQFIDYEGATMKLNKQDEYHKYITATGSIGFEVWIDYTKT